MIKESSISRFIFLICRWQDRSSSQESKDYWEGQGGRDSQIEYFLYFEFKAWLHSDPPGVNNSYYFYQSQKYHLSSSVKREVFHDQYGVRIPIKRWSLMIRQMLVVVSVFVMVNIIRKKAGWVRESVTADGSCCHAADILYTDNDEIKIINNTIEVVNDEHSMIDRWESPVEIMVILHSVTILI